MGSLQDKQCPPLIYSPPPKIHRVILSVHPSTSLYHASPVPSSSASPPPPPGTSPKSISSSNTALIDPPSAPPKDDCCVGICLRAFRPRALACTRVAAFSRSARARTKSASIERSPPSSSSISSSSGSNIAADGAGAPRKTCCCRVLRPLCCACIRVAALPRCSSSRPSSSSWPPRVG